MAQQKHSHWRNAIIEIAVALILVLFGKLLESKHVSGSYVWVISLAGAAVMCMVILRFFDSLLERRPTKVGNIGAIDGVWLDAIYDDKGDLIQGSYIEMSCSEANGFDVEGYTYDVDVKGDGAHHVVKPSRGQGHRFFGDGAPSSRFPNSCSYFYEGREHRPHKGSGFYSFSRMPDKHLLFEGAFGYWNLENGKVALARFVQGEYFGDRKKEYDSEAVRIELLEKFLRDRNSRYICSPSS